MKLSIIVVTTDRLPLTRRLFASLAAQSCNTFDVVFVHGPAVAAAARELAESFPGLDITILQSRDVCLSRSRNLALASVTGDIIAFADDDCVYEPDTVAEALAAFEKHRTTHVIMGRSVDIDEAVTPTPGHPMQLNRYSVFKGCPTYVHFYRLEVVRTVGHYDEHLGPGCDTPFMGGEETDYALRALEMGFSIVRIPTVLVRHPSVMLRSPKLKMKVAAYAAGRMRLLRKHNFPWWFLAANVLYPLLRLPLDCLAECILLSRYRYAMFTSRLKWTLKAVVR